MLYYILYHIPLDHTISWSLEPLKDTTISGSSVLGFRGLLAESREAVEWPESEASRYGSGVHRCIQGVSHVMSDFIYMSVFIYIYICIQIYIYVCMYVHTDVHAYIYIHTFIYAYIHVCMLISINAAIFRAWGHGIGILEATPVWVRRFLREI